MTRNLFLTNTKAKNFISSADFNLLRIRQYYLEEANLSWTRTNRRRPRHSKIQEYFFRSDADFRFVRRRIPDRRQIQTHILRFALPRLEYQGKLRIRHGGRKVL